MDGFIIIGILVGFFSTIYVYCLVSLRSNWSKKWEDKLRDLIKQSGATIRVSEGKVYVSIDGKYIHDMDRNLLNLASSDYKTSHMLIKKRSRVQT